MFFSVVYICPVMECLFTKMRRNKKKLTMNRLLSHYMFQCVLCFYYMRDKLLKIEAYDLLVSKNFDTLT